jgi:hypothetical protein
VNNDITFIGHLGSARCGGAELAGAKPVASSHPRSVVWNMHALTGTFRNVQYISLGP